LFLPGLLVNSAEIEMIFRRIHSPSQNCEQYRRERDERENPNHGLPELLHPRSLRRRRTFHPAQAWRTGELALLVRHAFTAECSAAMWTSRRRFPQRMKQATGMTQVYRG